MSRRSEGRKAAAAAAMLVACAGVGAQPILPQQPARPAQARAAAAQPRPAVQPRQTPAPGARPCTSVSMDPAMNITLGKSRVVRLDSPASRIVIGGQPTSRASIPTPIEEAGTAAVSRAATPSARPIVSDGVADAEITLLSPTELFILGRRSGSMNVVVQGTDGRCVVKDIVVTIDPGTLQAQLRDLMPEETGLRVTGAETSLVLAGTVSDAMKLQQVMAIAGSYANEKKIINLLRVAAPQQVMLEVKIAEVSKTLLDRLGLNNFQRAWTSGGVTNIIQGIIGGGASFLDRLHGGPGLPNGVSNSTQVGIDANKKDGIVRVLAEPNIVAISGQSASFLSGGKIFIPVAQNNNNGFPTITLEEKEFGVGLKFTPTVLDGRVNLKVVSEVSDLSQTGTPFTTVGGNVAILPSMTTRRVDTTVQLGDGQSFVVAGLIKNNINEALNKFPGLGEVPVMGALFRSSEFAADQTELMFVVTPRLAKPLAGPVAVPTDVHVTPSRGDVMLMGTGEGARPLGAPAVPAMVSPPAPTPAPPPASPAPARAPAPSSKAEPDQDAVSASAPASPVAQASIPSAPEPQPPGIAPAIATPVRETVVQPETESLDVQPK